MPLRNHLGQPLSLSASWDPLSLSASWDVVHGQWPAVIVQLLGKLLPPQFVAGPRVHLGTRAEVDVASFENFGSGAAARRDDSSGSVATAIWSATEPTLAIETELADFDE